MWRLDRRIAADLDHHTEIVGTVAVLVVDVQFADVFLAHEYFRQIALLRHHADMRVAEQLL